MRKREELGREFASLTGTDESTKQQKEKLVFEALLDVRDLLSELLNKKK